MQQLILFDTTMKKDISIILIFAFTFILSACKKDIDPAINSQQLPGEILNSEANIVIEPTYTAVVNDASALCLGISQFQSSPTQVNLINCRQLWLNISRDYEQTEAFLFGPVAIGGYDGLLNAYPIDTTGVDTIVNGNSVIDQDYISSLPTFQQGFHCMEFELYGGNGNKTATQFTNRQITYIYQLALTIQSSVAQLDSSWNSSISGNYNYQFVNAGNGSNVYPDQRAAYSDMIMAIANICETDNIYKMNNPLSNHNAGLEESPYANNSLNDIRNNLIGVRNIYLGYYNNQQGYGITNMVTRYNSPFDNQIRNDITNAINSIDQITLPLNQAIIQQPARVHNAMNLCDSLDDALKNDVQFFVDKYTN